MKPGSLKITKVLTNAVGEAAEKMFKFEVIIEDSAGKPLSGEYESVIITPVVAEDDGSDKGESGGGDSGGAEPGEGETSGGEPGDGEPTVKIKQWKLVLDENGNETYNLKGGQSIIIKGLPHGAYYEITEVKSDNYLLIDTDNESGNIVAGGMVEAIFQM